VEEIMEQLKGPFHGMEAHLSAMVVGLNERSEAVNGDADGYGLPRILQQDCVSTETTDHVILRDVRGIGSQEPQSRLGPCLAQLPSIPAGPVNPRSPVMGEISDIIGVGRQELGCVYPICDSALA
jgi:hypothetical protein